LLIDSQIGGIRDQNTLYKSMTTFNPDILIHRAAQPLVRYSYDAPIETYEVNIIGTAKVLEVSRSCANLKAIVNVTTDKCYENNSDLKVIKIVILWVAIILIVVVKVAPN
jgi:CDP-glucose 4,6-dehydratase